MVFVFWLFFLLFYCCFLPASSTVCILLYRTCLPGWPYVAHLFKRTASSILDGQSHWHGWRSHNRLHITFDIPCSTTWLEISNCTPSSVWTITKIILIHQLIYSFDQVNQHMTNLFYLLCSNDMTRPRARSLLHDRLLNIRNQKKKRAILGWGAFVFPE